MKESNLKKITQYLILFFFITPFIFFISKFQIANQPDYSEIYWAFKNSVTQSLWASCIVVILALPMSFGLLSVSSRWQQRLQVLLLLPQILPVFYSILILLTLINPYPMGNIGIITAFIFINLGLAAILLKNFIEDKLAQYSVVSEVYSISRLSFYVKIFFPLIATDLLHTFLLIFSFCFSSFAVPIMLGNGQAINLEILVYEKIYTEANWSAAFTISVIQSLFVFLLGWLSGLKTNQASGLFATDRYLTSKIGLFLISIYLLFYVGGYSVGIFNSISYVGFINDYSNDLLKAMLASLQFLTLIVLVFSVLTYFWLYEFVLQNKINLSVNFISFSTAVVGFSIYMMFPTNNSFDSLKFVYAFTILVFPTLFKLFLQKSLENLKPQIQVAKIFGISINKIVFSVIVGQLKNQFILWYVVLCLWVVSDFAVSKAIGLQQLTLGTLSQSLLSGYRLPASYLLSVIILFFILLFVLATRSLLKVGYVIYKKFIF